MRKVRRKKKPSGSWKVHEGQVSYHWSQGNIHEDIPADAVNFFEVLDPRDPSVLPRFRCEKWGGVMLPVLIRPKGALFYVSLDKSPGKASLLKGNEVVRFMEQAGGYFFQPRLG